MDKSMWGGNSYRLIWCSLDLNLVKFVLKIREKNKSEDFLQIYKPRLYLKAQLGSQ